MTAAWLVGRLALWLARRGVPVHLVDEAQIRFRSDPGWRASMSVEVSGAGAVRRGRADG